MNTAVESKTSSFENMEGAWTGDLRGNAFGTIFADSKIVNGNLVFDVRVKGPPDSLAFFRGVMQRPEEMLLTEQKSAGGAAPGPVAARLKISSFSESQIDGTIEMDTGAKSAVWLYRVKQAAPLLTPATVDSASMQVVGKETTLPTMILPRRELDALVCQFKRLLPGIPIFIVANVDGNNIIQEANAFLSRVDLPKSVSHLRLTATDTARPIHRSLFVALSNLETSRLVVQSDDAVWTAGAHQHIVSILDRSVGKIRALYHKHGLNLNFVIFLVAMVFMPDLPLLSRVAFLVFTMLLLFALKWVHAAITPVTIDLREVERSRLETLAIELSGATIVGIAGLALAAISHYMQSAGGVTKILERLLNLGAP